MGPPRIRIWVLMSAVALAALALTGWTYVLRSREYASLAMVHSRSEKQCKLDLATAEANADEWRREIHEIELDIERYIKQIRRIESLPVQKFDRSGALDAQRNLAQLEGILIGYREDLKHKEGMVEECRKLVVQEHGRAIAFERAARFPWLSVPPRQPTPGPIDDPNGSVGGVGEQWK